MTLHRETPVGDEIRHEAIVCLRLRTTVAGSHLLDHLRAQPFVVSAWWIAADIDAVVLLAAPTMAELHRAVDDLRLLGGALDTAAHMILRQMALGTR
ncbi:hypothetical protein [Actinoplanes sp. NPDC051851]|uniref:hypothetical protein n=1 Tax=Actinoplanes sp. NPDC051851 TaxID=3154753 RepID=UPI00342E692D